MIPRGRIYIVKTRGPRTEHCDGITKDLDKEPMNLILLQLSAVALTKMDIISYIYAVC